MKKLKLAFLLTLISCCIYAQSKDKVNVGTIETINSKILKEERKVWVYVPDEGPGSIFAKTTYPVVYLLDGDAHFLSVAGMIEQLSSVNGNTLCPKMIVVGIPNTNRDRDLTPTLGDANHPYVDAGRVARSGGGENFMAFIEKELMPHIESNYPTKPYKMLIGHSFGGLTVINTFLHHTNLFNSYISIDPSMWWGNKKLLKEIENTTIDERFNDKTLFLSIANTMEDGMTDKEAKKDTTFSTDHIRSILRMDDYLKKHNNKSFKYQGKYYADDDHGSVPLISEYDGIRFIFEFYQLKIGPQDLMNPATDLMAMVVDHSKKLSKEFGHEVKPSEELVNNIGYQYLGMEQFEKSEQFFLLNTTNYPESFNAYDSLGDYYSAVKNKKKAIESFRKSIELNKDSYSKEKLDVLLNE